MADVNPARVLIIDDEPLICRSLSEYLIEHGYETETAADGAQGLAKARAEQFDVVLVDLRMPHVNGLEVITVLKVEQPDLPMVVVSGTGVLRDALDALRRGAWDYVTKPIRDMDEIVMVVARVLEKARLIVQQREAMLALQEAHAELEQRVAVRTAELMETNTALQAEIAERARIEEFLIQSEVTLRESEERFRALVQNSSDVIVLLMGEGTVRYVSPAVEHVLGYAPEQFIGEDPFKYVHPDDALKTREDQRAALQQPGTPILSEFRLRHADGSWLYFETVTNNLLDYPGVQGIVVNARPIMERKRAEMEREQLLAQIWEQAKQVQQIMDTVPEGVLLLRHIPDAGVQVMHANPLGEAHLMTLTGAEVGDIVPTLGGQSWADLLSLLPHGLWHNVQRKEQSFQVIARRIEAGLTPVRWVVVIRDVTQEREIQARAQQQDRLAAVGQLAAGIAHDFNNIMATIVLYAQMVARAEALSERDQERMATIKQQAMHATKYYLNNPGEAGF